MKLRNQFRDAHRLSRNKARAHQFGKISLEMLLRLDPLRITQDFRGSLVDEYRGKEGVQQEKSL